MNGTPAGTRLPNRPAADARALLCSDTGGLEPSYRADTLVSRSELFAGLALVGLANGISEKAIGSVLEGGVITALLSTFGISAIVWIACAIGIGFVLREPAQRPERSDWIVAVCVLTAILVPIVPLSWLAVSALSVYILRISSRSSFLNRGAWILLAVTFPMFWSRLLFAALSGLILQGDAALVGWLIGTQRLGNAVQLVDGSGYLWIAPGCSSLANVSLAILCWVAITKALNRPNTLRDIGWIMAACSAVIAVNVTRISLIGYYPSHYDLLHGPVGATVASWIILGVTVGICWLGVQNEHRPACA